MKKCRSLIEFLRPRVPSCAISSAGASVLLTRTAQILNSGIFDTGSMARTVMLFAERSSGQW